MINAFNALAHVISNKHAHFHVMECVASVTLQLKRRVRGHEMEPL